jgi:hypothetical protein
MDLPWPILTRWASTQQSLPRKNLFIAFVEEATEMNHGTICSNAEFRRHQPTKNTPMTLPQVLYIHQVLYQVVIKANNKDIGFDEALKIISDSVNGAGTLMSMHVLSVLTLTGNCLNREFLRRASLTDACKKNVREKLFPGQEITQTQMKTALNGVVRKLGMSEYLVENLLCESIRKEPGFDTFHPSQSIFFLDENTTFFV